jgi:hypothetical protein
MNPKIEAKVTTHFWPAVGLLFSLALGVSGCVLFYMNRQTAVPASWGAAGGARNDFVSWFNTLQIGLIVPLMTGLFGNLILRRRVVPRMGVLFICLSLLAGLMNFLLEYAILGAYTQATPLSGTSLAAWVNNFAWVLLFSLALYLLALFPNGRFLSPRWRIFIFILLGLFIVTMVVASAIETPLSSASQIANPFFSSYPTWLYNILFKIGLPAMALSMLAVLTTVLVRYRRSHGRERQQMKWLLTGVALMVLAVATGFVLSFEFSIAAGDIMVNGSILWALSGIGVALVRHQLYDIDIIIRRTLLYTAVSALLALVYFGSVVLLQTIFNSMVAARSPIVIVISTLVSAALFSPLRRQLQALIDHRFYRQKVDAQQVLAHFAHFARDEVELETLTTELIAVVKGSMHPEHISVWFRAERNLYA